MKSSNYLNNAFATDHCRCLQFSRSQRRLSQNETDFYCPDNPYILIYDFFWDGNITHARAALDSLIAAALNNNQSSKPQEKPDMFLYYLEQFTLLIEAMHLIYTSEEVENNITNADDFIAHFKTLHAKTTGEQHFPRHLNIQELQQPRLVIHDFFTFSTINVWKLTIHRLVQSTYPDSTLQECMPWQKDIFTMCLQLHRLIEAAWIIKLLEIPAWED